MLPLLVRRTAIVGAQVEVSQFSSEPMGHTLQPMAVVDEAWLRITATAGGSLDTEAKFRQWAANIVR